MQSRSPSRFAADTLRGRLPIRSAPLALVVLGLGSLVACASATPSVAPQNASTAARAQSAPFFVPAEESLAYYTTMRWGGQPPATMSLILERDLTGHPRLVTMGRSALDHRPYPMTDEDAVTFIFPQPPRGRPSVRRVVPLRRLSEVETDPEWVERVWWENPESTDLLRRVSLERRARLAEGELVLQGWGLFDTRRGRYLEIHYDIALTLRGRHTPVEASLDLSLDRERSARRTRARVQLRQAFTTGRAELRSYAASHDVDSELRAVSTALVHGGDDEAVPASMLWFHARAHPAELWRRMLSDGRGSMPEALVWALIVAPVLQGEQLPDDVVVLLLEHLEERPDLRLLATQLPDPRFEPLVRRWAAGELGAGTELREAAQWALEEWESDRDAEPDAIRAAFDDPEAAFELLTRYLGTRDDPRPVVPVLIEWLGTLPPGSWEWREVRALLQRLMQVDFEGDVEAWRAHYAARADVPYVDWLLEGTRRPQSRFRLDAYQELAAGPESEGARAALRRGLRDPHPLVRMVSAEGLAHWGDPAGATRLIELLDASDAWIREAAFMSLAAVASSTLGYDPRGPEVERARAIGRWRAWNDQRNR